MDRNELLNLVAFCIVMQNGSGIIDKSPDYVVEKYNRYMRPGPEWMWGLDAKSADKLAQWEKKWKPGTSPTN